MNTQITTYDTLWSLVDIDTKEHEIKKIASLFLEAMNDWPTKSNNISEYVIELEKSFGKPLSSEIIKNKGFSKNELWRGESGAVIEKMILESEKLLHEHDFYSILESIITYYEQEFKNVDFIAELKFYDGKKLGRKTSVKSGYRPHIKFDFSNMNTTGHQTFINREVVKPGETVNSKIKIASPEICFLKLSEGTMFEFYEGSYIIGTGKIQNIINSTFEKP